MIPRFVLPALAAVAGIAGWQNLHRDPPPVATAAASAATRADHPPGGEKPLSSKDAALRLKAILHGDTPLPDEFAELEKLARYLHPVELMSRISSLDGADPLGAKGRIRCALFAEWGRRDAAAALDFADAPALAKADPWVERQIDFSIHRGWADSDPAAAFADLIADPPGSDDSRSAWAYTVQAIFYGWVKRDSNAAWQYLAHWPEDLPPVRDAALAGFFEGLPSTEYASRAGMIAGEWRGPQALQRAREQNPVSTAEADHYSVLPDNTTSPTVVAAAWARYDPDAALDWLATCEGPLSQSSMRQGMAFRWASQSPRNAFQWLVIRASAGEQPDEALAHGIFLGLTRQDPALAASSLEMLPAARMMRNVLVDFRSEAWSQDSVGDYLPGLPGTRPYATAAERQAALKAMRE